MSEQPSSEELLGLLNGLKSEPEEVPEENAAEVALARALGGGYDVVSIPAKLDIEGKDEPFICEDFRSWGWSPVGVFAIGRWDGDETETRTFKVFPFRKIESIELEADAFTEAGTSAAEVQEQAEAQEEPNEPVGSASTSD